MVGSGVGDVSSFVYPVLATLASYPTHLDRKAQVYKYILKEVVIIIFNLSDKIIILSRMVSDKNSYFAGQHPTIFNTLCRTVSDKIIILSRMVSDKNKFCRIASYKKFNTLWRTVSDKIIILSRNQRIIILSELFVLISLCPFSLP